MASKPHVNSDPTFGKYTIQQARQYAIGRAGSYPAELYTEILRYHEATGGQMKRLLDLGCGHGKATCDLSSFFDTAIGTDHSREMINVARSENYMAKEGPIEFEVASAEDFDTLPGIQPGSVDLITAAMAAHWFNMDIFWPKAASVLKAGGTVAFWTCASQFCHPLTPNAAKVQEILFDLEYNILGPFATPGNRVSQKMYDTLQMPWDVEAAVKDFNKKSFTRIEWNRDGKVGKDEDFLVGGQESVEEFERGMSTASMVTRWRQAHPDLAGTDQDCVTQTVQRIREALGGEFDLKLGHGVALLLLKKRI